MCGDLIGSKIFRIFDIIPKHALLPIIRLVPSKFINITSDLLAYVFIQQGVIKKIVLDNLKESASRIVKQQLNPVGKSDDSSDIMSMEVSEECKILLDSFLYFKSRYESTITSDILTAYVTYIMISDKRISCSRFFKDCIYVKEYSNVINSLYGQLSEFIGVTRSDTLIDYGEYLTDPLIYKHYDYYGRDSIVQECIDVLCRYSKANLALVGNAGVGKTSIVYEICNVISSDKCPDQLKSYNVFALDVTKLTGGTTFRGDLEKRLDTIITELKDHKNIILFVDEMQYISGNDSDSKTLQGALKPYLSESSKVIGCTTEEEYKTVESDHAFERRFTKVIVPEMTVSETIEVLKKKLNIYTEHHDSHIDFELIKYLVLNAIYV